MFFISDVTFIPINITKLYINEYDLLRIKVNQIIILRKFKEGFKKFAVITQNYSKISKQYTAVFNYLNQVDSFARSHIQPDRICLQRILELLQ